MFEKRESIRMILFPVGFLLFQLGFAFEGRAEKDEYPNRPIQLILPWSPGSSGDVAARVLGPRLGQYFGQPFLVINKPGGGGIIGHTLIAKSKPDGYTLGAVTTLFSSYLLVYKDLEFEFDSFVPICAFSKGTMFFMVRHDARWKNLKEFIAEAKKNPGKLRYGTIGVASAAHLVASDFCHKAEINVTHIPQTGTAVVINALLGGHIDLAACWGSLGHLKGGTVRALAIGEKQRLSEYPDIPTLTELGYPIACYPIRGHVAPKGTSKNIIEKLSRGYQEVLSANKAEISDLLKKTEEIAVIMGPDEYYKRMREDYEYMREVFKGIDLK